MASEATLGPLCAGFRKKLGLFFTLPAHLFPPARTGLCGDFERSACVPVLRWWQGQRDDVARKKQWVRPARALEICQDLG